MEIQNKYLKVFPLFAIRAKIIMIHLKQINIFQHFTIHVKHGIHSFGLLQVLRLIHGE